jgi:biopolymer transport protein ExbD
MRRARTRTRREPTIALINIVFLMLVFFMVAGTLAQPLDGELKLIRTTDLEGRAPPDALVIGADGALSYHGAQILSPAGFMRRQENRAAPAVRLVPDRELPARDLVRITRELQTAGAGRVLIVTEKALE